MAVECLRFLKSQEISQVFLVRKIQVIAYSHTDEYNGLKGGKKKTHNTMFSYLEQTEVAVASSV